MFNFTDLYKEVSSIVVLVKWLRLVAQIEAVIALCTALHYR